MTLRIENLNNQKIHIVDDVLEDSAIRGFYEYSLNIPYKRHQKDFIGDPFLYFSAHFEPEKFKESNSIGKVSWNLLSNYVDNSNNYFIDEVYINLLKYGDMQFLHRDCELDEKHITVLYYVNEYWDYKWGGETIFYNKGESVMGVLPKPGRFVIFPGNIEHMAGVPNVYSKQIRLSLALKFKLKEENI